MPPKIYEEYIKYMRNILNDLDNVLSVLVAPVNGGYLYLLCSLIILQEWAPLSLEYSFCNLHIFKNVVYFQQQKSPEVEQGEQICQYFCLPLSPPLQLSCELFVATTYAFFVQYRGKSH